MNLDLPSFLQRLPGSSVDNQATFVEAVYSRRAPGTGHAAALWWPSNAGESTSTSTVVLFVPGNPGILKLYAPFLTALHEKCAGAGTPVAILAKSHLGHTCVASAELGIPQHEGEFDGLEHQVASAIEALDDVRAEFGERAPIVLIGHSVGAWIVTQMLNFRPENVARAFLLFPTISHIGLTPNGRRLSWLFRRPFRTVVYTASILAHFIPEVVYGFLFSDWPEQQRRVLRAFVETPSAVRAGLVMADDEMRTIKELESDLLVKYSDRICLYFAEKDDWVGDQRDAILRVFDAHRGSLKIVHGHKDIPHAFSINHGEQLASQCFDWIQESSTAGNGRT